MTKKELAKNLLGDKSCKNCGWHWVHCSKDGYDEISKRNTIYLGPTCEDWRKK